MATKLAAQELFELSKSFHDLAAVIGDYRYAHWDSLTPAQRAELESKQWTLFNTSSDLNGKSVVLKARLLEEELQT